MMKLFNHSIIGLLLLSATVFYGCDDSDTGLIDRVGRPAVNTALNSTFKGDAARNLALNTYNTTENLIAKSDFKDEFAASLAVYDGLVDEDNDGNSCGDNPITNRASAGADTTLATGEDRYSLLAGVLADDLLYVNGAFGGTCNQYLAVELNVLGVPVNDCGGRHPSLDVIGTTYSVVATGTISGADDGVAADDATLSATFPFLAAPQ